jgi:hypothetical protein
MSDEPSEVERYRPEGEYAQRHYAAIGKVAAEWAEFEFILDTRTLRLAGFPAEKGTCLTAQIAHGRNSQVFRPGYRSPGSSGYRCSHMCHLTKSSVNQSVPPV